MFGASMSAQIEMVMEMRALKFIGEYIETHWPEIAQEIKDKTDNMTNAEIEEFSHTFVAKKGDEE